MAACLADFDFVFKVVVLGDGSVGKSSLIRRFYSNEFDQKLSTTIGVDLFVHDMEVDGKKIKLELWDTAGEERFQQCGLTSSYFRGAHGVFIVFSLTSSQSFENVKKLWIDEFYRKSGSDTVTMILIGNKRDLEDERQVSEADIKKFAELNSMCWLETSAKDCTNVQEAFETMAYKLCESHKEVPPTDSGSDSFTLLNGADNMPEQQLTCCACNLM